MRCVAKEADKHMDIVPLCLDQWLARLGLTRSENRCTADAMLNQVASKSNDLQQRIVVFARKLTGKPLRFGARSFRMTTLLRAFSV